MRGSLTYKNPKQLETEIAKYFDQIDEDNKYLEIKKPYTLCGLIYYLGFADKSSFYDIIKNNKCKESSYLLKRARLRIENMHEENMSKASCTGSLFVLKNMGWSDIPIEPPKDKSKIIIQYNEIDSSGK